MRAGRSAAVDAVRAAGMLAVVAGHLWGAGLVRPLLYSWHVPVFFVLSGYLWKSGRSVRAELRGRSLTLLVPYAAWAVLIGVAVVPVLVGRGEIPPLDPAGLLRGGRAPTTPFWTIWFVTTLFFSALWMRLLERFPPPFRWAVAAAATVLVAVGAPDVLSRLPLGLGQSAVGLLYLLAGAAFARLRGRVPIAWPWALAAVVLGLAAAVATGGGFDLKPLRLGAPVVGMLISVIVSAGLIVLAERLLRHAPAAVDALVSRLGRATLVVLFVHVPVAYLIGVAGPDRSPLGFLLVAAISWALGLLLLAVPGAWPLTGAGRPGPRVLRASAGGPPAAGAPDTRTPRA